MQENFDENEFKSKVEKLSDMYYENEDKQEVLNLVEDALKSYPENFELLNLKANILLDMGNTEEACEIRKKTMQSDSDEVCDVSEFDANLLKKLKAGETILKKAIPKNSIHFTWYDLPLFIFAIIFSSVAIALFISPILTIKEKTMAEFLFFIPWCGFCLCFVGIGVFLIYSRLKDKCKAKNGELMYLITNKRICTVTKQKRGSYKIKDIELGRITDVDIIGNSEKTADVTFTGGYRSRYYMAFENIYNAYEIYAYASRLILGIEPEKSYDESMHANKTVRIIITAILAIIGLFVLFPNIINVIYMLFTR